jgi:hypothetical protein
VSGRPEDPTDVMPDPGEEPDKRPALPDEEPTEPLAGGGEPPTERLKDRGDASGGPDETKDAPTESLPGGSADPNDRFDSARRAGTEEMRVRGLAAGGVPPDPPTGDTEIRDPAGDPSRRRGLWTLAASIVASIVLVLAYIAAGGLDYKPAEAADPCEAREWTDPGNLEETAQQFALSAIDGAACELGVSREELTRALADEQSRAAFAEEKGLSEGEIEEAVRAGINRAIDDAEEAGAIGSLVATGLRAAVRVMPIDQMIPLLEDATGFLSGDTLRDVDGLIDGVVDSFGGSVPDPEQLPESITEGLRDQLPEEVQREIPDSVDERVQRELDRLLNP